MVRGGSLGEIFWGGLFFRGDHWGWLPLGSGGRGVLLLVGGLCVLCMALVPLVVHNGCTSWEVSLG